MSNIQPKLILSLLLICLTTFNAFKFGVRQKSVHIHNLHMSVAAKSSYKVTLLTGDGIGPEIMAATLPALEAVGKKGYTIHILKKCVFLNIIESTGGFKFEFTEADIGGIAIDRQNDPFPESSLALCRKSDSILLACIGGYKWDNNPRHLRPETGLLKMRKELG